MSRPSRSQNPLHRPPLLHLLVPLLLLLLSSLIQQGLADAALPVSGRPSASARASSPAAVSNSSSPESSSEGQECASACAKLPDGVYTVFTGKNNCSLGCTCWRGDWCYRVRCLDAFYFDPLSYGCSNKPGGTCPASLYPPPPPSPSPPRSLLAPPPPPPLPEGANMTPAQSCQVTCCGRLDGSYVMNKYNCSIGCNCTNGMSPNWRLCPPEGYFDVTTESCRFKPGGLCPTAPVQPVSANETCPGECLRLPDGIHVSKFSCGWGCRCVNFTAHEYWECPSSYYFNTSTLVCVKMNPPGQCPGTAPSPAPAPAPTPATEPPAQAPAPSSSIPPPGLLPPPLPPTTDPPPGSGSGNSSSSSSSGGGGGVSVYAIVGAAVGAGVALAVVAIVCWFCPCFGRRGDRAQPLLGDKQAFWGLGGKAGGAGGGGAGGGAGGAAGGGGKGDWEKGLQAMAFRKMKLAELKTATNGFSEANLLGKGAFGAVYSGVGPAGQMWAVKRASRLAAPGSKEEADFENEVRTISQLSHRNLVRLLGYCTDRGEQILVYELATNGSLHDALHKSGANPSKGSSSSGGGKGAGSSSNSSAGGGGIPPSEEVLLAAQRSKGGRPVQEQAEAGNPPLSFVRRLDIAIGTAEAIHYLHQQGVIHRDIKPGNVLLDAQWQAKVGDFGLLKLLEGNDGSQQSSMIESVYTRVAGTPGYLDPDYYRNYKITPFSDVYSYGMLLLEMLTGRRPIMADKHDLKLAEARFQAMNAPHLMREEITSMSIKEWFPAVLRSHGLEAILDPRLHPGRLLLDDTPADAAAEEAHQQQQQEEKLSAEEAEIVNRLLNLCRQCIQDVARSRPGMAAIVTELTSIANMCIATRAKMLERLERQGLAGTAGGAYMTSRLHERQPFMSLGFGSGGPGSGGGGVLGPDSSSEASTFALQNGTSDMFMSSFQMPYSAGSSDPGLSAAIDVLGKR